MKTVTARCRMHEYDRRVETHPHLKEFFPFLDSLNKESERGAVLISASYLEGQLREIIAAFLCEMDASKKILGDGFNAPLGTFAARIAAAAALALISEDEYQELETIRKIRNIFAHNHRKTFVDQDIVGLCGNLKFSARDYAEVIVGARGQFTTASVALILGFVNRPHYVSKKRLKFENWPN